MSVAGRPCAQTFARVAEGLDYSKPEIPIVSNVTGELATNEQLSSPSYWVRHVRQAVRFLDGVRTLRNIGLRMRAVFVLADEAVGVDKALDEIRPYIHSHSGDVNIVDVSDATDLHVHVGCSLRCLNRSRDLGMPGVQLSR